MSIMPQRGVALVTALLIIALVTVVAVAMASQQQIDIRRSANIIDADQAYQLALGVEAWAQGVLVADSTQNQTDSLRDNWATTLAPIATEGGKVAGVVSDLQGRFNLNNLVRNRQRSDIDVRIFQRLLANLQLDPDLASAVVDWLDPDVERSFPNGAEDAEYLGLSPAYRAANAPMQSVSELLLVRGVTPAVYAKLAPLVCALPESASINVNTAPAEVLAALTEDVTVASAQALLAVRKAKVFASVEEFAQQPVYAGRVLPQDRLGVASSYFLLAGSSEVGRGQVQLYSMLYRAAGGTVKVLMRGRGSL